MILEVQMLSVDFTGGAASHVSVSEESATSTLDSVPWRMCNFNTTGLSAHAGVDSFCCRLAMIAHVCVCRPVW